MMGKSDLLLKAGRKIGGEPGVPDGVGAKKGEQAAVLGDAADFVHLPPFGRRVSWRNLSDWAGALLGYAHRSAPRLLY